jgi:predicted HTH domain antitoxin
MTMRRIVMEVPEQLRLAEEMDDAALGRELCTLAALKLYELGRVSSGVAAELAGMSRVGFLMILGRYEVFPLEAELLQLEVDPG